MNTMAAGICRSDTITLDLPLDLPMDTPVLVRVFTDDEPEDWLRLSAETFASAYGDDEPEFSEKDIIPND
jgi:hypothetical protein